MFRPILATAAIVAAIAAGLAVYSIVSPNIGIDPAPEPTSVRPSPLKLPDRMGPSRSARPTRSIAPQREPDQLTIPRLDE